MSLSALKNSKRSAFLKQSWIPVAADESRDAVKEVPVVAEPVVKLEAVDDDEDEVNLTRESPSLKEEHSKPPKRRRPGIRRIKRCKKKDADFIADMDDAEFKRLLDTCQGPRGLSSSTFTNSLMAVSFLKRLGTEPILPNAHLAK